KTVYHIESVEILIFTDSPLYLHHMGRFRPESAAVIMVIKSVQYSSVKFHMIKIVDFCSITPGTVSVQTEKSLAFQKISVCAVSNRTDLRFLCGRKHLFLFRRSRGNRNSGRQKTQNTGNQDVLTAAVLSSFHRLFLSSFSKESQNSFRYFSTVFSRQDLISDHSAGNRFLY